MTSSVSVVPVKIPNGSEFLAGLLNVPSSIESPLPVVLVLHGLGGYKESVRITSLAESLAENGFIALRFDATGIGESDGENTDRFRVDTYRQNIDTALTWLVDNLNVDSTRVGICGHSLGGLLSIIAASEDKRIKAVCAISPPDAVANSSVKAVLPEWNERGWISKEHPRLGEIRLSVQFLEGVEVWNPVEAASKVSVPMFVVAGNEDIIVPVSESKRIWSENQTAEWLLLDGIGHGYSGDETKRVDRPVVEFFSSNL